MSKGAASTTVLVAGGVLVALAVIPGSAGESTYKRVWAAGLLTVGLGVMADFVPEIVGPFALLVIIAAVVKQPGVLGKFISGKSVASTSPAPTGGTA